MCVSVYLRVRVFELCVLGILQCDVKELVTVTLAAPTRTPTPVADAQEP